MAQSNKEVLLACMVEDTEVVEQIEEIAAVNGVDLLAVGPVQIAPRLVWATCLPVSRHLAEIVCDDLLYLSAAAATRVPAKKRGLAAEQHGSSASQPK